MALSTYTELKAALLTKLSTDSNELTDGMVSDAVNLVEAKINRRTRVGQAERLAEATYSASTNSIEDRTIPAPLRMTEMITLAIKKPSEDDTQYRELEYVSPNAIYRYYGKSIQLHEMRYTYRRQIEFSHSVSEDHSVLMHYLKGWDLAAETTGANWLLTHYPDLYVYGSLLELSRDRFAIDKEMKADWKEAWKEGMKELNALDERNRDDAQLDVSEVARLFRGTSAYNIVTG